MKLSHILAVVLVIVICLVIGIVAFSGKGVPAVPAMANTTQTPFDSAGALYSRSVDLANAGKYADALTAADQALAQNTSALTPIIQANRAGILVMLGRYEDANAAADVAISAPGNLTTPRSIAYYNKGDALRHLNRIDEAKAAYAKAAELDPALTNPYKS